MTIGNTTQFGDRGVLREIYAPAFEDAVFRNNQLLGLTYRGNPVIPEVPMTGGAIRFPINYSGNSSAAVFTEGAAAPQPVAQSYLSAAYTPTYFWAWCRVTGHVRDQVRNGAVAGSANPLDNELMASFEDVRDLMNTSFMASTYGLELMVDDGSTNAGIAQGTYTWWAGQVTNHNGALTRAGLLNIHEKARDTYGGKTDLILTAHNQATNYIQLTGEPNAQNSSVTAELGLIGGGALDIAPSHMGLSFMGAPIVPLQDWTDTIWLGLDLRRTKTGPNVFQAIARDFDIRGPQMAGDDDVFEVSSARLVGVRRPQLCWKLEDVTA